MDRTCSWFGARKVGNQSEKNKDCLEEMEQKCFWSGGPIHITTER